MALLPIVSDEEASPEQQVVFKHSKQMFGRVANAVRIASHTPRLAQVLFGFIVGTLREEITENLKLRTKVLVILKTSMLNQCAH